MDRDWASSITADDRGRLYHRRLREHLLSTRETTDIATSEALAALRLASHHFRTSMDRWLERHDLSEGRMAVLGRLRGMGPMTLGDLATELNVSPRNITGLIDHLERDGLVQRMPDPTDRRAVHVQLRPAGEQKVNEVRHEMERSRSDVLAGFTDDEIDLLRHLCLKLACNLQMQKEAKV
jgi:DNA-binding MarR family transcriptional regulator